MYCDLSAYHYGIMESDSLEFGGRNTLTLNVRNANRRYGKIEGSVDVIMLYGVQADAMRSMFPEPLLSALPTETTPVVFDLRKLYFSIFLPFADIAIGRQIVNLGKGFVFSPADAFASVDIVDLNFRRRGSDVVSARFPFGDLAGVDLVSELPSEANEYASAARFFTHLLGFDWSALGIYHHDAGELTAGVTFKGDLELGVYGEAVEHFGSGGGDRYFEAMMGVDYSFFGGDLIAAAEYLHSGSGGETVSVWGKHNVFASVQYRLTDIMRISGNAIHDFTDDVTMATLQYYYNILQNVDLISYVRGYRGDFGGLSIAPDAEYAVRIEVKF